MVKVLLVDDSVAMRKIMKRTLKECGFIIDEFLEAGDGKQALEVVIEQTVDLILIDWNMPVMSGIDFIRSFRSIPSPKRVPIVMVTTESSFEKLTEANQSGADHCISKPVDKKQLQSVLGQYLKIG